jgi:serine/threonine protein kinase
MHSADHALVTEPEEGNSDALPPGTTLLSGQYIIDGYLSSGGFGITYHARDSLDRRVVIKECYPEALCRRKAKTVRARSSVNVDEFRSLVAMFVREARSIAKLNNPNIIGVHQVFEDNETAYMALDLIEGEDLLCVMENNRDRLTPQFIVGLLRKLLNAVATVHAVDMLHRDISPDNILLDQWGNPILIDFGAAREEASKKSRAISAMLVVKDGYSPQEFYISGSKQGPWSDLYSLAATFFHLIDGNAPPNSQNRLAALASRRPDPYQPLAGRVVGYDGAFLRAIDQAMSVFPLDRLQSASAWLNMIDTGRSQLADGFALQTKDDLLKVVARIVDEVGQALDGDAQMAAEAPTVIAEPQRKPVEKEWEYLPPAPSDTKPDRHSRDFDAPTLWFKKINKKTAAQQRTRHVQKVVRRSSVLVMVCAVAFAILEAPPEYVVSFETPDLGHLIDLGRYWTARTTDLLPL